MKSLLVLILMWLLFQYGALLFTGRPAGPSHSALRASAHEVQAVIERWPPPARHSAQTMIERYGLPDSVLGGRLSWKQQGAVVTLLPSDDPDHGGSNALGGTPEAR